MSKSTVKRKSKVKSKIKPEKGVAFFQWRLEDDGHYWDVTVYPNVKKTKQMETKIEAYFNALLMEVTPRVHKFVKAFPGLPKVAELDFTQAAINGLICDLNFGGAK